MAKKKKRQVSERYKKYNDYLDSAHWKNLRAEKLKAEPCCQNCGSDEYLQVHHIRYWNLIDCALGDLAVLCTFCHKDFHRAAEVFRKSISSCEVSEIRELIKRYRQNPRQKGTKSGPLTQFQKEIRALIRSYSARRFPIHQTREFIDQLEAVFQKHKPADVESLIANFDAPTVPEQVQCGRCLLRHAVDEDCRMLGTWSR